MFTDWSAVPAVELIPGFRVRMLHSNRMTFAMWEIEKGGVLPEHSHPHEQVAHMISGEFELVIAGEKRVLTAGMVAVIPGDALHSGIALSTCRIMDAFYPIREDYLKYGARAETGGSGGEREQA